MSKAAKKKCAKCGNENSLDDFYASKTAKDGHQSYCKECMKAIAAKKNWERQGIDMTPELRAMIDEANDFRCAICDRTSEEVEGEFRELSVDHDHTSGKTRNLLCQPCNQAIGLFREDPDRMRTAADYVEFYYTSEVLDSHDPRTLDEAKARPSIEEFFESLRSQRS